MTAATVHTDRKPAQRDYKQGHVCCGFCCDVRRAVIFVDMIAIIVVGITLATFLVAFDIWKDRAEEIEEGSDNSFNNQDGLFNERIDGGSSTTTVNNNGGFISDSPVAHVGIAIVIAYAAVAIIFYLIGIFGAIKYSKCLVLMTCLWYVAAIVWDILSFNPVGVVIDVLFLYPHIALFVELKRKIMTHETYHTEKYSCCCV